jgi:hypothetical protein
VNDLAVDGCVEVFEVRNLQGANGLDRRNERFISLPVLS